MTQATFQDPMPEHPLLNRHAEPPLIETSVSKVIAKPRSDVFEHFWGSDPKLRLELHRDHVKGYSIHKESPTTLEYDFVFEAYGTRNWGRAVEVAFRPDRIEVEVKDGPLKGQTVTTLFEEVDRGTRVTQVNRVWPTGHDLMVKMLGSKLRTNLTALAGVHLEQHRHDLEGLERFQDRFSREHQRKVAEKTAHPVADFLKTTRAIALPTIVLPLVAAAALASAQGVFSPLALVLTLVGGGAALLGANLLNDLYDFKGGADQSARTMPGAIETGSGAFVEGRWSLQRGWLTTALLFAVAATCGLALAWLSTPLVLAYAAAGAVISYTYVGPPFPLAYKGRGLGELAIFAAFGLLPVAGGVLAHGGEVTAQVLWVGALFGLTSDLMLYHHHFLHWEADKAAAKWSPIALLGPRVGAGVGLALVLATSATAAAATWLGRLPAWGYLACLPPLLLVRPQVAAMKGARETPAMVGLAKAAFGAMSLTGLALVLVVWIA
ncbi:MAG TPA: prenyltransferase [Candidatus Thermoplasmatota archaeon]|nr:prenyltransferase [Candidatus Thermoplasmatota archaeon]